MNNYADSTVLLSKVWDQVMNTWQEILKTVTHLFLFSLCISYIHAFKQGKINMSNKESYVCIS